MRASSLDTNTLNPTAPNDTWPDPSPAADNSNSNASFSDWMKAALSPSAQDGGESFGAPTKSSTSKPSKSDTADSAKRTDHKSSNPADNSNGDSLTAAANMATSDAIKDDNSPKTPQKYNSDNDKVDKILESGLAAAATTQANKGAISLPASMVSPASASEALEIDPAALTAALQAGPMVEVKPGAATIASGQKPEISKDSKIVANSSPVSAAAIAASPVTGAAGSPGPSTGGKPDPSPAKNPAITVTAKSTSATGPASQASTDTLSGISSAQQAVQMKKMAEMSNPKGSTEQNLPVNSTSSLAGENLPMVEKRTFTAPTQATNLSTLTTNASSSPPTDTTGAVEAAATSIRPVEPSAILERAVSMIAENAIKLSAVGNTSLQVVIKPGGDTQLSLDLQQRNGTVEVQATLQHGDFSFLKQHWNELQQQLESRGVRLSSLAGQENSNSLNAEAGSQFKQQSPARREEETLLVPGLNLPGFKSVSGKPEMKTPVTSQQGWEFWA